MKKYIGYVASLITFLLLISFFPVNVQAEENENTIASVQENTLLSGNYSTILSAEEWEMLIQINKIRAEAGARPLVAFEALQAASDIRAKELYSNPSNTRPDGTEGESVLKEKGIDYTEADEWIIRGYQNIKDVINEMMAIQKGKEFLLGEYQYVGIGYNPSINAWVLIGVTHHSDPMDSCMLAVPADAAQGAASVEDLGLCAVVNSLWYGECYLPVLSEYCSGYAPNKAGDQLIALSVLDIQCVVCIGHGSGLMEYAGDWYYVENGQVMHDYTGLAQNKTTGAWYYMKTGKIAWDYVGFAQSDSTGTWYYIQNGRIAWDYMGLAQNPSNRIWYYVKNGCIAWSYTGFAQSSSTGTWYYVRNGRIAWDYTGLAKSPASGTWFYVRNGCIAWSYTGFAQSASTGTWYYVRNGRIDWGYTGLAKSPSSEIWYYVRNGCIAWKYNGFAQSISTGAWYRIQNGRIAWNFNGIAQNPDNSIWYYVKNGCIAWMTSGTVEVDGVTYTVVKGVVQK